MDDQNIIALFFERSEQAVSELIAKHGSSVRKVAANILQNPLDVEECTNDTYLRIWNAIPPERPRSLRAFACSIARNSALTRYHSNTAQKRNSNYDVALDELEECVPALDSVETEMEARELTQYINQFLSTQSYDDRFLFVRRYYYADSVSDIAAAMHAKPHFVSVRLSRLRDKLQHYLKKEGMLP